jgi:ANTAR domain
MYTLDPVDEMHSTIIHQAVGMTAVYLNCDVVEAFARLKIRARTTGTPVHMIAFDIVDRIVRFD